MTISLTTERLSVSPLGTGDLASFVAYRRDPEVARFQSWESSYTEAQGLELIKSQIGIDLPSKGEWLQLAIRLKLTQELIGDLALHCLNEHDEFEIGFTLGKQFQGQGYAKEATSALIEHLIQNSEVKRFIATPDSRNTASIRLLRSLGFVQLPEKSWNEFFKGENVTVDFFELVDTK